MSVNGLDRSFRLGSIDRRTALASKHGWIDVGRLSGDERLTHSNVALADPTVLGELAQSIGESVAPDLVVSGVVGPCVPAPRQIFAIGLNYHAHADEIGLPPPTEPLVFTKFASSLVGPGARVAVPNEFIDWEAEVVVVIGQGGRDIPVEDARSAIAAITVGQDLSDRRLQMAASPPQFSLGKSRAGFTPLSGVAVGIGAVEDLGSIGVWCSIDGETVQRGHTSDLIFSIPSLVAYLSEICELLPGDLIFTGTPPGVGSASGRFLRAGEELVTGADLVGDFVVEMVESVGTGR